MQFLDFSFNNIELGILFIHETLNIIFLSFYHFVIWLQIQSYSPKKWNWLCNWKMNSWWNDLLIVSWISEKNLLFYREQLETISRKDEHWKLNWFFLLFDWWCFQCNLLWINDLIWNWKLNENGSNLHLHANKCMDCNHKNIYSTCHNSK